MTQCDCGKMIVIAPPSKRREETVLFLQNQGISVAVVENEKSAREFFHFSKIGMALIDVDTDEENHLAFASEMKRRNPNLLLLLLTAKNCPELRLKGLETGADDILIHPYTVKELMLRLQRRCTTIDARLRLNSNVTIGKIRIDFDSYKIVDADGVEHQLSKREIDLLRRLYDRTGFAIQRKDLCASRSIDNYVVKLRKIFQTDKDLSITIESVHGYGYRLVNHTKI